MMMRTLAGADQRKSRRWATLSSSVELLLAPSRSRLPPLPIDLASPVMPVVDPPLRSQEECVAVGDNATSRFASPATQCVQCLRRRLEGDFDTQMNCAEQILCLGCHLHMVLESVL